jgi:hypothetical protein
MGVTDNRVVLPAVTFFDETLFFRLGARLWADTNGHGTALSTTAVGVFQLWFATMGFSQ